MQAIPSPLMSGKRSLVMGVANQNSIGSVQYHQAK
jgi:enoyl-[acyl-carrier-protein] reductase (NADH)